MKNKLKKRAETVRREIPALFLALSERRTPILAKILAFCAVAYVLSPVDLIPDFVPFFGYLDDVILVPLLASAAIALIPDEVMETCRKKSETLWQKGIEKRWYYILPIIAVWLLSLWLLYLMIKKSLGL